MSAWTDVSCSVRVPHSSSVSAVHLLGQRVTSHFCCFRRRRFTRLLTIHLQPEQCHQASADTLEFCECRVTLERDVVKYLDCAARLKVKRGKRTVGKQSVDAWQLLELLQADRQRQDKFHLSVDITSFSPLTVSLQVTGSSLRTFSPAKEIQEQPPSLQKEICWDDSFAPKAEAAGDQPLEIDILAPEAEAAGAQPLDTKEDVGCENPLAREAEAIEAQTSPTAHVRATAMPQAPRQWRMSVPRRYRRKLVHGGGACVVAALRRHHNVTVDYDVRSGVITLSGLVNDIMGCHDEVEGILKAWLRQDEEARQCCRNRVRKRAKTRQTKQNLDSPPVPVNSSSVVKANSVKNTSTSKDKPNFAVKSVATNEKRLSYAQVVTGKTSPTETVTEKVNVNNKKELKTWAEEVDEAYDNSQDLHAFPESNTVHSCLPASTTAPSPESSVSLQHSAASPAAAAPSRSPTASRRRRPSRRSHGGARRGAINRSACS